MYCASAQVTERIRSFAPGRGRGRGIGAPGGPLPGRGPPGRGAYSTQPDRPEGPGPAHFRSRPDQPYARGPEKGSASNGYPDRPPRDAPRSSVMDRLGPRNSQDRRHPSADLPATKAAPSASEVSISFRVCVLSWSFGLLLTPCCGTCSLPIQESASCLL